MEYPFYKVIFFSSVAQRVTALPHLLYVFSPVVKILKNLPLQQIGFLLLNSTLKVERFLRIADQNYWKF